jgi:hypothetical protein
MLAEEIIALPKAPASLAQFANKQMPFGLFAGIVPDATTTPWQGLRRSARKVWIYAGAFNQRYYTGFAIADAGLVATAFAYVFDAETKKYVEEKTTVPFGFASTFDPLIQSEWRLKNFSIVSNGNTMVLTYKGKRINLEMQLENDFNHGLTTIAPAADRPFNHTYKDILMPAKVTATVDGESIAYGGNIGSVDFSKGYPPRSTFWNWVSMVGETASGQPVGLNLVAQHNNSLENSLWTADSAQSVSQCTFEYKQPLDKNTWAIRSLDGIVDLTFTPLGKRAENINAIFMVSKFVQPFGVFEGTVRINGTPQPVKGYGVVEEHFAKW